VLEVDSTVGQIMKTLDKCGVADNTLLIFTSDNGFDGGEGGTAYPLRGKMGRWPLNPLYCPMARKNKTRLNIIPAHFHKRPLRHLFTYNR
jgi:arylsulfatase A-like enzyme